MKAISDSVAGARDFEFLYGVWLVQGRRRREPRSGCDRWERFEGIQKCWPLLNGLGNVAELVNEDEHAQHEHEPTTPETELELLQLDPAQWTVEIATTQSRQATGPEGQQATLDDTVVLARRTGANQDTGS